MKKKTMMNDKDLSWFLDNQDDEMDNEVIPQTEAHPVPVEETTTDVEMNEDSVSQGEADITSGKSEHTRHTENMAVQRRISSKMRKKTLEAYKQAYLVPTKLSNRKAVYLNRETQSVPTSSCADWATRAATFQVSWRTSCAFIWRSMVRT